MSPPAKPSSELLNVPVPGIPKILFFESVASTNEVAKQYATGNQQEGVVIVADKQTHGRGRHNRTWVSPEGGIYFSVLLRPSFHEYLSLFPLLAAVSVASTLESYDLQPSIKWPNDVHLQGKKIAGILVESSLQGKKVDYVIVGIGLNVNQTAQQLPVDVAATSLFIELQEKIDRQELLFRALHEFQQMYTLWKHHKFDDIVKKWKGKTDTLGKQVSIQTQSSMLIGTAVDVDTYGRLLLQAGGQQHVISSGDCLYLKQKTEEL